MNDDPLITRKEVVAVVRAETGIPLSESRLEKLAMLGKGPEPAATYGRRYLYSKDVAIAWARSLIRPIGGADAKAA